MKSKFVYIFSIAILIILSIGERMYKDKLIKDLKTQNDMYESNINAMMFSEIDKFLFIGNDKLLYDGGPSHWGSRTVTFVDLKNTKIGKIVNLHVIDESDMKGEDPKSEWNQKWETNKEGSLYIDDILMLKSPLIVGQSWVIEDYTPVVNSNKYTAKVKITDVSDGTNDSGTITKNVTTTLTIDELITVDGIAYTEVREFESGIGLKKFTATEPTISNLTLSYWLYIKK